MCKYLVIAIISILVFLNTEFAQAEGKPVYDAPDQVLWHAETNSWYVSNLGGGISLDRDGYGWINKLDAHGNVIVPHWVDGLDAPSGMIATKDHLYVVDRTQIIEINIQSGKIDDTFSLSDAVFPNDITISDKGDLYVSDFFANVIYKLPATNRIPEIFVEINNSPDGLYLDGENLIVVTWGANVDKKTFKTTENGTIIMVNLNTKEIAPYSKNVGNIGNLEGITKSSKNNFYVTDWMNGVLFRVNRNGVKKVLSGLKNPTDPDYSKEMNIIAFPEHTGNRVIFLQLPE